MSAIDDLPPLREVIRRHDLRAKKSLGQNFLLDINLTSRIARAAGPFDGVTVVEIGPDITFAAWRRRAELDLAPFYLLADPAFIARSAERIAPDVSIAVVEPAAAASAFKTVLPVVDIAVPVSAEPGRPDQSSAPAALAAIRRAVADVHAGAAAAVVTNPVAKNVLYRSGFTEPGHTEYLAKLAEGLTGVAAHPVMMLWAPELAVVPVTIHLPLKDVVEKLTIDLIVKTGRIVARDLRQRARATTWRWRCTTIKR